MRLFGGSHVEGDYVRDLEELLQRHQLRLKLGRTLGCEKGIVSHELHAERARQLGDLPADSPQADDAHRLAAQLTALEPLPIPLAAAHGFHCAGDTAHQGEQQRHGVLGGADGVGAGRIHDGHTPAGGGVDIDVVHARPCASDHSQVRRLGQQLRRHARFAPHDQGVRPREGPQQLVARLPRDVGDFDFRRSLELREPGLGHPVGDHDAQGHTSVCATKASSSSSAATV